MHPISLVFKDNELEAAFQKSTLQKTKVLVQHLHQMNFLIVLVAVIIELCYERYITAGLFSSQILTNVFLYIKTRTSQWYLITAVKFFTIIASIIPIFIYIVCKFTDLPLTDKFAISSIAFISQTYFIMTHKVTLNTFLYLESIAFTFAIHQNLLGFSPYQVVYFLYSFYWIIKNYQNIYTERRLYQESQINQSFVDIITNICEEKIIIFSYDQNNIKFQNEIINNEAFKYFKNNDVNQILKKLFFKEKYKTLNLGKQLFQTYIEQKNYDQKEQVFEGFFQNDKQKLKIHLYIHQNPKLKFILKIKEIIPVSFNSQQYTILVKQQSYTLNQISAKFKKYFNFKRLLQDQKQKNNSYNLHSKLQKYQQFLQVHRVLEQLNKLRYGTNLQLKITEFNLTAVIINSAQRWFSSFHLAENKTLVETDIFLINILMDTIFIIVSYLKLEQTKIFIKSTIIDDQFVNVEIQYKQNRNKIKCKFDKSIWKQSFQHITTLLCQNEQNILGNGKIEFTLIKNLGTKFQ